MLERAEKTGSGKRESRPKSEKSARKGRTIDKNYEFKKRDHLLFVKNRSNLIHDKNVDFVMKGFCFSSDQIAKTIKILYFSKQITDAKNV